jgi:hypothetical protein
MLGLFKLKLPSSFGNVESHIVILIFTLIYKIIVYSSPGGTFFSVFKNSRKSKIRRKLKGCPAY